MNALLFPLIMLLGAADPALGPGDHQRELKIGDMTRTYLVHVPPQYDPAKPTPVVLNFHGAWMDAALLVRFSGLNEKSDQAGFIAVYPNGTGVGMLRFWNSGIWPQDKGKAAVDDVAFTARLLDDLATVVRVDPKRVYATGLSNGAMMCHRLGSELADRIAAIAPIAGTISIDRLAPSRPVPVVCMHGKADTIVPFNGVNGYFKKTLQFKSVDETISMWVAADGCPTRPKVEELPDKAHDGTRVTRKTYAPGREGSEVILYEIEGGGHTWPGRDPVVRFLGKYTQQISANDVMWEFFQRHSR